MWSGDIARRQLLQHRLQTQYGVLNALVQVKAVRLLMKRSKWILFRLLSPFPGLTERIQRSIDRYFIASAKLSASSGIFIHLDQPAAPIQVCVDYLHINGWAFALDGHLSIDVYIGETRYKTFKPSWFRADLQQVFPELTHNHPNAFRQRIDLRHLEEGRYKVRLSIHAADGRGDALERTILLLREPTFYNLWQRANGPDVADFGGIAPLVHILYPWSGDDAHLEQVVDQLLLQGVHWVLYILGPNVAFAASKIGEKIAFSGNSAHFLDSMESIWPILSSAPGYFMPFTECAVLRPGALRAFLAHIRKHPEADLLYSDRDVLEADGSYSQPCFTFEWSPDHLKAHNYIGNIWLGRNSLLQHIHPVSASGAWSFRLLLELGDHASRIVRIPRILWSESRSAAQSDKALFERQALEGYLRRKGLSATIHQRDGYRYLSWLHKDEPLVSIIIPTTARLELIKPCLDSIRSVTTYKNLEIIVLDNSRGRNPGGLEYLAQSGVELVQIDEDFNWSRFNNIGAAHAVGSVLLFLNDDTVMTDPDWLSAMVREAVRSDVGAVGGLLLYPDGSIQHGGVLLVPFGGGAMHALAHQIPGSGIPQHLDAIVREVSANTGACLMVERDKFRQVGGFDETLAVVGNDIDLCLKLGQAGYRNIWTPACRMLHCESVSRKSSVPKRDELAMWTRWEPLFTAGDPYYHPAFGIDEGAYKLSCSIPYQLLQQQFPDSGSISPANTSDKVLREGINMIAYIRAEMGLGEAARNNASAMDRAGIEFAIMNFESGNPARMLDFNWVHREVKSPVFSVNLIHINPDHLHRVFDELPDGFFENRYNIGFWAWELPEIPLDWLPAFKRLHEIWVPSEFVRKAVSKHSSIPVVRIPHCVVVEANGVVMSRSQLGIPDGVFVFLVMFDPRSITARKNPDGAIAAFMRAFAPSDTHVLLLLKVKEPEPGVLRALEERLAGWPNIRLVSQHCDRAQTNALLTLSDAVVSLHRSEGFGLVPAEAMALGKCAILTNWSGNTDYMTPDNCIPVGYELTVLDQDHGPYQKGQVWAEPDLDDASRAMRALAEDPDRARRIGEAARVHMATHFSPAAVGAMMQARLEQIHHAGLVI